MKDHRNKATTNKKKKNHKMWKTSRKMVNVNPTVHSHKM